VFKHTGWRLIGGSWVYLHAGGAIGLADGADPVSVELDGPLGNFRLPAPPEGEELKKAIRASLRLLRLSRRIMVPLLGTVYRSVLDVPDFTVYLSGHTGVCKSELSALAQQHFGAGMDRLHLPGSWSSTGNALEGLAFLTKNALLVIDDFKPSGSRGEIDRMHQM